LGRLCSDCFWTFGAGVDGAQDWHNNSIMFCECFNSPKCW
jgi:hypothetical protein